MAQITPSRGTKRQDFRVFVEASPRFVGKKHWKKREKRRVLWAWVHDAGWTMIDGAHVVIYSKDAEADRAFLRDVLKFPFVDAHGGWLIFKLPPSEVAVHPSDENDRQEFFLMTDDLDAEMAALQKAGVACEAPSQQGWGRLTRLRLPGGGTVGLYQPRHERP